MVIYLLLLLLPLIVFLLFFRPPRNQPSPPLPPGPKPWPIIGNLLQLTRKPHISLQAFSRLHGPLISLRLGSQILVVASSPATAAEILKAHDLLLSARFIPKLFTYSISDLDHKSIIWASDCNDTWKRFRSIFKNQIFSAKAIESQAAVRERKAVEMVEFVTRKLGKEINIGEVVFVAAFDSLSNLFFSRDCIEFEETAVANKTKSLIEDGGIGGDFQLDRFWPDVKTHRQKEIDHHLIWTSKTLCHVRPKLVTMAGDGFKVEEEAGDGGEEEIRWGQI